MNFGRYIIVKFTATVFLIIISGSVVFAQDYKYEIGGATGISSYWGDANIPSNMLEPGLAGSILFRYNANLYWSIKSAFSIASISGNSENSGNVFPSGQNNAFRRTIAELSTQAEFNFLPYGDHRAYLGTKTFTPYLFSGIGFTYGSGENAYWGLILPVGLGFKYKLENRMNVGLELSVRKLFNDDLDVTNQKGEWNLESPFGIDSSILKNQDWYTFITIFWTWNFRLRKTPCP